MKSAAFAFALTFIASLAVLPACNCGGPNTNGGDDDGGAGDDAGAGDDGGSNGGDGGVSCLPLTGPGTVMVGSLPAVRRLGADGTFLYATVASSYTDNSGRVIRINLNGGLAEDVATGLSAPDSVTADPDGGVPIVLDQGGVWRINPSTKTKTRIDTSLTNAIFGESSMVVDGDSVIVATGFRALDRVKIDGSGKTTLFLAPGGSSVRGAVVSGTDVFFLVAGGTQPGIYKVPKDGSASAARVRDEPANGHALLVDGASFIWSEGDQGTGRIATAPIAGGVSTTLADGLSHPLSLARVGSAIYFKDTTNGPPAKAFLKAATTCGLFEAGPDGVGPGDLLERGGVLYFSSEDFTGDGHIARLP